MNSILRGLLATPILLPAVQAGVNPVNDDCNGALPALVGASVPFDTTNATASGIPASGLPIWVDNDTPNTACQDFNGAPENLNLDVWFSFVPTVNAAGYSFSTCGDATYDTKLALYSGTCANPTALSCNDDGTGCTGFSSLMLATGLNLGQSYLIQVGGFGSTSNGTGNLTIDPLAGTQNYCVTTPNSAGTGALITSSGSTSLAADDLVLEVTGAPPNETGIFFWGIDKDNTPFYSGVQCIQGPLNRLNPILMTSAGSVSRAVSRFEMGFPLVGDARFFQFYYRDSIGQSAANTSDGLAVVFGP